MWVKYCKGVNPACRWYSSKGYFTNAINGDLWSLQQGNKHTKLLMWTEGTGRLCWPVCFWHDTVLWGESRADDVCSAKSKHAQFGFHWIAEVGRDFCRSCSPAHLLKAGSVSTCWPVTGHQGGECRYWSHCLSCWYCFTALQKHMYFHTKITF